MWWLLFIGVAIDIVLLNFTPALFGLAATVVFGLKLFLKICNTLCANLHLFFCRVVSQLWPSTPSGQFQKSLSLILAPAAGLSPV